MTNTFFSFLHHGHLLKDPTACLGLNFTSVVLLVISHCKCMEGLSRPVRAIRLLSVVVCLEPLCQPPCQTAFCRSRSCDRRIDCMRLYFTGCKGRRKKILRPEGLVAYQRPSGSLQKGISHTFIRQCGQEKCCCGFLNGSVR